MEENNKNIEEELNIQTDDEDDIEFDDNIDIDAIQAQLQEHMALSNVEYDSNSLNSAESENLVETDIKENSEGQSLEITAKQESNLPVVSQVQEPQQTPVLSKREEKLRLEDGEKKFVVYIEPSNIPFIESLSIKERKKVINEVLKEQDIRVRRQREIRERTKFTNQVIIMVITVIVSLPLFFMGLNKAIEITILNYQQSQQNFVKLYKEQGKIKSYKNFQRHFD